MIDLERCEVIAAPFPHFVTPGFLEPLWYSDLEREFPADHYFEANTGREYAGGRIDFGNSNSRFGEFLAAAPAWSRFYSEVNSERFVRRLLGRFQPFLGPMGARFSEQGLRLVGPPRQPGLSLPARAWRRLHKHGLRQTGVSGVFDAAVRLVRPNDVYVQMNIGRARSGYEVEIHTDNRNKLLVLLLYFSDMDELTNSGGDLLLLRHRREKPVRNCERYPAESDVVEVARVRPRRNLCVGALNTNHSYHSTSPWEAANGFRRFVYIAVVKRHIENAWDTSYFSLSDTTQKG
jgi:hypothetical protein